jgi:hypothetical protein
MKRCPHCARELEPTRGVQTYRTPSRPGGRQVSYARGVRVLAAFLYDEGYVDTERRARRIATRWLRAALPTKQKHPRKPPASELREAA